MIILALDTCLSACSVAVLDGGCVADHVCAPDHAPWIAKYSV